MFRPKPFVNGGFKLTVSWFSICYYKLPKIEPQCMYRNFAYLSLGLLVIEVSLDH